jgi:hypothetical protein
MNSTTTIGGKQVYEYFFECTETQNEHKCRCCTKILIFSTSKGYSNAMNHLRHKHSNLLDEFISKKQVNDGTNGSNMTLDRFVSKTLTEEAHNLHTILEYIIFTDQPFSCVENKYFRKLFPTCKLSRNQIVKYIERMYCKVKTILCAQIPDHFGLMFDGNKMIPRLSQFHQVGHAKEHRSTVME